MAIKKITVKAFNDAELKMYGEKTRLLERILLGVYGGVSKIPSKYRNNPKLAILNLPPMKGKVHHLVPLGKTLWTKKDKIRFLDDDKEVFVKDLAVKKIQDVSLVWSTGMKPAMQKMEVYVDMKSIGELRLYAGVLVYASDSVKEFMRNEGYDNMVLFAKLHPFKGETCTYNFQLLTYGDLKTDCY